MLHILTQCAIFSMCGMLIGHFLTVKWLRVVAAVIECLDNNVNDVQLATVMEEMIIRVHQEALL